MKNIITYGGWVLRILLALMFLFIGAAKLIGVPMMVQEFDVVGVGQWFRYIVGIIEVVGAILIVSPKNRHYGASLMLLASVGAFFAQLLVLKGDVVHTLVLIVLTGLLVWQDRNRFRSL